MRNNEQLPINAIIESVYSHTILSRTGFISFRQHVAPLDIQASGDVLILHPSTLLEELGIIESRVADGSVTNVTVTGASPVLQERVAEAWQSSYQAGLSFCRSSWGGLVDSSPDLSWDTIIRIGTSSGTDPDEFPDKLTEFSSRLNPEGKLYLTVYERHPCMVPDLPGFVVRRIKDPLPLPYHPEFPDYSPFLGFVVKRQ